VAAAAHLDIVAADFRREARRLEVQVAADRRPHPLLDVEGFRCDQRRVGAGVGQVRVILPGDLPQ
jgi:hypothetical protein